MTYCSTYIVDLSDPDFHWEGGTWNGNIPRRLSPVFPWIPSQHYNSKFYEWVEATGVVSKQTDFDGFVAIVTKAQILDFVDFCYEMDAQRLHSKVLPDQEMDALNEVLRCVAQLRENKHYALVAQCF